MRLPDAESPPEEQSYAAAENHRSRVWLERILHDESDLDAWKGLAAAYEGMAAEWQAWVSTQSHYLDPVAARSRALEP